MPPVSDALLPLKRWFLEQKRDLPWRENPTPYAVWISEVMLQQTQVAVVIPYFLRWMELFPTIKALAEATPDAVIKAWEGLGYYSRARNLHLGAQYLLAHHEGALPSTYDALKEIKGLGPYTIGAILSFAFHQKAAAVDGNVVRVMTRFLRIEEDISKPKTVDLLRSRVEELLPDDESWIVNEALIELGATVCQKKPKCSSCPLRRSCRSHIEGVAELLPVKSAKIAYQKLERTVAVIVCDDQFLVKRGSDGAIMHDLHEFPYLEEKVLENELTRHLNKAWSLEFRHVESMEEVSHSFTKYRVRLYPFLCHVKEMRSCKGYDWKSREDLQQLAFSSGHRRVWRQVASANLRYL